MHLSHLLLVLSLYFCGVNSLIFPSSATYNESAITVSTIVVNENYTISYSIIGDSTALLSFYLFNSSSLDLLHELDMKIDAEDCLEAISLGWTSLDQAIFLCQGEALSGTWTFLEITISQNTLNVTRDYYYMGDDIVEVSIVNPTETNNGSLLIASQISTVDPKIVINLFDLNTFTLDSKITFTFPEWVYIVVPGYLIFDTTSQTFIGVHEEFCYQYDLSGNLLNNVTCVKLGLLNVNGADGYPLGYIVTTYMAVLNVTVIDFKNWELIGAPWSIYESDNVNFEDATIFSDESNIFVYSTVADVDAENAMYNCTVTQLSCDVNGINKQLDQEFLGQSSNWAYSMSLHNDNIYTEGPLDNYDEFGTVIQRYPYNDQ